MPTLVYSLCAATSLLCTMLLLRGWWRTRVRLMLWSGLCFAFLTLNNLMMIVDLLIVPQGDLSLWRDGVALVGILILVHGLIWDARRDRR